MPSVTWTVSTEASPWLRRQDATLGAPSAMPAVFVELDRPQQAVKGFGACFNEMGWDALSLLDVEAREAVLADLFAPGRGLELAVCRMPVGANDFSRDWYSYDETPGDLALDDFSIAHDDETLVPFIRAAQRHRQDLRLWASPWSPPTWMKVNGHYAGAKPLSISGLGAVENGIGDDQLLAEGTDGFRLEDEYLDAYARYFGKFVDAYRERGIDISMVMPQNEFNSAQIFPSCTWSPGGLAAFIARLGPEMDRRGVEVFLGTLERADDSLVTAVLDDADAGPWVKGLGAQWAGRHAVPFVHHDRPDLAIYQTEQECGDGANDWRHARHAWTMMRQLFSNGATVYDYWNIALVEGGVSRWGWSQNSLVVVDPETRTHRLTHEYYVLKHLSHLVPSGSRVIPTTTYSGFEDQLVFRTPSGDVVIAAFNALAGDVEASYLIGDRVLTATLPADSLSTFVVSGA